jgi:hypothetical protein
MFIYFLDFFVILDAFSAEEVVESEAKEKREEGRQQGKAGMRQLVRSRARIGAIA